MNAVTNPVHSFFVCSLGGESALRLNPPNGGDSELDGCGIREYY